MNVVRVVISLFILVLIALSVGGLIWAGDQPSLQSPVGCRVVLTVTGLAGVGGLVVLWRPRPTDAGHDHT
jgi:hypothetical protein